MSKCIPCSGCAKSMVPRAQCPEKEGVNGKYGVNHHTKQFVTMKEIRSIVDVCKYCNPDSAKIVCSKTEVFETTHSKTAVVLRQMGVLYYVACVTPGTTSVERLVQPTTRVTMRSLPKLINNRLEFLANTRGYSTPLEKRVLYEALAATPELEMLNELEGHLHPKKVDVFLPWGLTSDAQLKIVKVYMDVNSRENAGCGDSGDTGEPEPDEQSSEPSGGSDDGCTGKRKRNGR